MRVVSSRWFEAAPEIEDRGDGLQVVREDLLEGGSKVRFLPYLVGDADEIVFGGPFCGGAPYALSVLGREFDRKVTLFYAERKKLHPRQIQAADNGATIVQVPHGRMSVVQSRARKYCERTGALFLPLGFDVPEAADPFIEVMAGVRQRVGDPDQVWCATGSGMLARCLGVGFPNSEVVGVAVGLASRHEKQRMPENVRLLTAPEKFEQESKAACPFPSNPNYDLKAWAQMVPAPRRQDAVLERPRLMPTYCTECGRSFDEHEITLLADAADLSDDEVRAPHPPTRLFLSGCVHPGRRQRLVLGPVPSPNPPSEGERARASSHDGARSL